MTPVSDRGARQRAIVPRRSEAGEPNNCPLTSTQGRDGVRAAPLPTRTRPLAAAKRKISARSMPLNPQSLPARAPRTLNICPLAHPEPSISARSRTRPASLTRVKHLSRALLLAILLVSLSACGGSGDKTDSAKALTQACRIYLLNGGADD